ncbi:MAG: sugar phosphate isomerase/epimerase family protein [Kiritimatiellia bacterium]|nr:sugar phosphate isomerase/epimerase [Lentisphaerota bacterium]
MASKIAAQMYTLREFLKTPEGLADSLKKISKIGYQAVQLSGVGCMNGEAPAVTAAQARRMLDDQGLRCIATHRAWAELLNNTPAEIDFHLELGCNYVAIGSLPGEYKEAGAAGYRRFLQEAAPVIDQLNAAGLAFGYHNHSHEFCRTGQGRETLYDILIEEGAPKLQLEIDFYWVAHAGLNPERLVERCQGRIPVVHVKDKEVIVKEGPVMAPVGEGNLDWAHLLPACHAAGTQWYAVEQDKCLRDPFDCLRSSFEYLSAMGL